MANTFKKVIDRQIWAQVAPAPVAASAGVSIASDLRSDLSRNPFVYQLTSSTVLNRYNIVQKGWNFVQSPALAGTFGAGSTSVFAPARGLEGTIAAGATTTSVTSTTVITAVGVNMLANRGGSGEYGFKLRVIGKVSGKTEERFIIGNTGGTTPTFTLDSPLTFTPATGDSYEMLAGRLFMLGAGTTASNIWRSIEVSTNALSSGLSTTGLPATIATDSVITALDEQYTPYYCEPGEGFIKGTYKYDENIVARYALVATNAAAGTLTGQATGGDATVVANEYRNFQIRIVEDTTTPTAVGQRRIIASHTAGTSPVYTLGSNWTVQPSDTAKYVIEYPNLMLLRSSATTTVYTYNYNLETINNGTNTIASNSWSTTYFAVAPAVNAVGGMWAPAYGIEPDPAKNARQSFVYFFRGGATTTADLFDIAGGTTGAWTAAIVYDGGVSITTGTCGNYAPFENEGRFFYCNIYTTAIVNQMYRFDVKNRVMAPITPTDFLQSGTAAVGQRVACYCALDGTDKYDVVLLVAHASTVSQELVVLV